ncbi:MAG: hypothetical protein ACREMZ_17435 [Gemmatimonadales bacterium]
MRADLGPLNAPFSTSSAFEGSSYDTDAAGTERYFKVRGQLLSRGRSKGYFYYFEDSVEQPPPGVAYQPDCSTAGERYRWHARRR